MKKYQALLKTVAAVALASAAGTAMAATTSQILNVSASVDKVCKFTGTVQTLNFNALDPSSTADASASASASFKCTNGTPLTVSDNAGSNSSGTQKRLKGPGAADYINYSISLSAPTSGTGFGSSAQVISISGTILNSAYVDAPAGSYADTVQLTITY